MKSFQWKPLCDYPFEVQILNSSNLPHSISSAGELMQLNDSNSSMICVQEEFSTGGVEGIKSR